MSLVPLPMKQSILVGGNTLASVSDNSHVIGLHTCSGPLNPKPLTLKPTTYLGENTWLPSVSVLLGCCFTFCVAGPMTPWLAAALAALLVLRLADVRLPVPLAAFVDFPYSDVEDHLFVACPHTWVDINLVLLTDRHS